MNNGITTINRAELINYIEDNRKKHEKEYKDAMIEYRTAVTEKLKDNVEGLKALLTGECNDATKAMVLNQNIWSDIEAPEHHAEDFERALQMLRLNPNDVIELSFEQFDQYVNNKWRWQARFGRAATSNRAYLMSKGL